MNDEPSMNMDEQRMVTLILCVILALGSVGLVALYFVVSGGDNIEHGAPAVGKAETELSETTANGPSLFRVPDTDSTATSLADKTVKETIDLSDNSKSEAENSVAAAREESELVEMTAEDSPSSRVSVPTDSVDAVADTSKEENVGMTQPQGPLQVTIYETSKDNGTFYSAQEITESVIVGKRGSAGDRADYYKVRATGKTMILKLEPSLKEEIYPFAMVVFDAGKKSIGRSSGETDPAISLDVTPQDTYYIKLNLSSAPIETPQYELNIRFK